MTSPLHDEILTLEQQLLQPQYCGSSDFLQRVLAEDFVEFGQSGQRFHRNQIIELLCSGGDDTDLEIEEFEIAKLDTHTALATYRAASRRTACPVLRSSPWQKHPQRRWQLRFHQGTPTAD